MLAIGPAISNAGPVVNNLVWQTGMDYWRRLQLKHINFERPYYSNKDFKPASYSMAANEWKKAVSQLIPIVEGANRKNAAKAAYNLAVVQRLKET